MRAVPVVTHLAAARFVRADVLVTEEAEVRHGTRLPRLLSPRDPPPARGHALTAEGSDLAVPELQRAIDQLRAVGAGVGLPYDLGALAVAHAARGDVETALGLMDEALRESAATGERLGDAELHRQRAAILIARDAGARRRRRGAPASSAEEALGRALAVARAQGARWFELRAAVDLARLWSRARRTTEARALLALALERYAQDSDLPDLGEAFALRRRLGSG